MSPLRVVVEPDGLLLEMIGFGGWLVGAVVVTAALASLDCLLRFFLCVAPVLCLLFWFALCFGCSVVVLLCWPRFGCA
jgi:hypothetical protein